MKELLGIVVLVLLCCNVGFASEAGGERETGSDQKCFDLFERKKIFEERLLPNIKKKGLGGVLVAYVGCNKYYDNWSWDWSTLPDIETAHEVAYYGCKKQMKKYKLTGCHLFSIGDVIVWGKNPAFVAILEKDAYAKQIIRIDKNINKMVVTDNYVPWVYRITTDYRNFNGTFLTSESPSTLKKLIFKKKKNIPNIQKGEKYTQIIAGKGKKLFRSFNFVAEYEDDIKVEFFIEYEKDKEDFEKAKKDAEYFSNMYGQMPHFLKIYNKKIYVHEARGRDDGTWWASGSLSKREFHINRSTCGYRLSKNKFSKCAVIMIHELAHVIHKNTSVISPSKWLKAKKLDKKKYCSKYAKKNNFEDFAESIVCWIFVRHKPHTIKLSDNRKILTNIPNRIKFFDEKNFNVYPF